MDDNIRKRRDTPEGPEEWSVSRKQKSRDLLMFLVTTPALSLILAAPLAALLAALYWNQGLGGTENLPWIVPTSLAVSLLTSLWVTRRRLWWTVRFEDYRLHMGNRYSGKVIPCDRVCLVRAGAAPDVETGEDHVVNVLDSMERMVPLEVISEGAGRAKVHLSQHDAIDLLHFLHWQCPEAVIVHPSGEHVLPRSQLGRMAARRRQAKVNLTMAGLQATVALIVLGSGLATLILGSLDGQNPAVLASGFGVLVSVGFLISGSYYSARHGLRCLKKAREERSLAREVHRPWPPG